MLFPPFCGKAIDSLTESIADELRDEREFASVSEPETYNDFATLGRRFDRVLGLSGPEVWVMRKIGDMSEIDWEVEWEIEKFQN